MTIDQAYTAVVLDKKWKPRGYAKQTIANMRHMAKRGQLPLRPAMVRVLKAAGWRITTHEQWAKNNGTK